MAGWHIEGDYIETCNCAKTWRTIARLSVLILSKATKKSGVDHVSERAAHRVRSDGKGRLGAP
ncbi:MAG: hypothetical protein P8Y82_11870, partial [Methyloceanibacter sp.]